MAGPGHRLKLAHEPDFVIAGLRVSPSACRIDAGADQVRIEAQTMAALVLLARASGATITREDLVEACWQGRIVSDDAVARTIAKVRAITRGMEPSPFRIETIPKIGYRLVEAEAVASAPLAPLSGSAPREQFSALRGRVLYPAAVISALLAGGLLVWGMVAGGAPAATPASSARGGLEARTTPQSGEVAEALFTLDAVRIRGYLASGWDPNWNLDSEGNTALHALMLVCERNPTHDKQALTEIVRILVAAGADPATRNGWGDDPLSIAMADRYCGVSHPVVTTLREALARPGGRPAAGLRSIAARTKN